MRKNSKPYLPKTHLTDPQQIRKMLGSMIDIYDHGLDLGNKQIIHCNTINSLNYLFSPLYKPKSYDTDSDVQFLYRKERQDRARSIRAAALKTKHIKEHINQMKKRYYTSDPLKPVMMQGWDTDNSTADPEKVVPFRDFFQQHFPSFNDTGSSGKSLHYYPKFNMVPLYDYYEELFFNQTIDLSWSKFANHLLSLASYVIKIYGQTILAPEYRIITNKGQSKCEYLVEFDAIKGTYPDYTYHYYCDSHNIHQCVIAGIISCGVLFKLPNLLTTADILCFINSPVYSIIDLLSWVIELVDELLHSCSIVTNSITNNTVDLLDLSQSVSSSGLYSSYQQINSDQVNKLHNITAELRTILKGHTIIIPSICRENNVVSSNQAELSADTLTLENKSEENKNLVYMPGHSPEKAETALFLENKREENKNLVYMPGHSPVKAENTPDQRINRETGSCQDK